MKGLEVVALICVGISIATAQGLFGGGGGSGGFGSLFPGGGGGGGGSSNGGWSSSSSGGYGGGSNSGGGYGGGSSSGGGGGTASQLLGGLGSVFRTKIQLFQRLFSGFTRFASGLGSTLGRLTSGGGSSTSGGYGGGGGGGNHGWDGLLSNSAQPSYGPPSQLSQNEQPPTQSTLTPSYGPPVAAASSWGNYSNSGWSHQQNTNSSGGGG